MKKITNHDSFSLAKLALALGRLYRGSSRAGSTQDWDNHIEKVFNGYWKTQLSRSQWQSADADFKKSSKA